MLPALPYIPLLSPTLPPPPSPVGYATVRASTRPWCLPTPVFRAPSKRAGEPALRISTSTWALYYPADPDLGAGADASGAGVQWMPEPVAGVLRGYDRYFGAGVGWLLPLVRGAAARYRMPLAENAPLKAREGMYPLVIFSHGVCGTRTTYSQWAAGLASEGYVVLAVEHGDGSGPCVLLPDGELEYTVMRELEWDSTSTPSSSQSSPIVAGSGSTAPSPVSPTAPSPADSSPPLANGSAPSPRASQASFASLGSLTSFASTSSAGSKASSKRKSKHKDKGKGNSPPTEEDLRALQLDQRVREIYAAHDAFVALLAGSPASVDGLDDPAARAWAATFASRVDTARPALAGHSFGASTVFRALEAPPDGYSQLDISAALALDHWWDPFPPLTHRPSPRHLPPILAINSQEYTQAPQWPHILASCRAARANLVTIVGTNHESFCDLPVIVTSSPATGLGYLATVHRLAMALLRGTLGDEPAMRGAPDGGEFARTWMGRMAGRRGDVVVHLRAERVGDGSGAEGAGAERVEAPAEVGEGVVAKAE